MYVRRRKGWELPERVATAEGLFLRRRQLVGALAAGPILATLGGCGDRATAAMPAVAPEKYPGQAHRPLRPRSGGDGRKPRHRLQ